MSYKVAIASTDGINVDAHFGGASSFLIYEVNADGSYENIEERIVPGSNKDINSDSIISLKEIGNGCGSSSDCTSSQNCSSNSDCSSNSGCGSENGSESGSGASNGGGCGGHSDSKIDANVSLITDCRCLLCNKVGAGAERQLGRKAITAFQVDYKIEDALAKIINYYTKIDNHISLRSVR